MNSILVSFALVAFAITSSMAQKFQYSYDLKGVSGYKERFSPDMSDDSELKRTVLVGNVDSIKTMVRRLTSSYNGLQYLVIDNYFVENGAIQHEVNLQSIYAPKEIQRSDDWKLVSRLRLSNDNILAV